jgi:Ser-tRNA(Ala) deacylase AlaX
MGKTIMTELLFIKDFDVETCEAAVLGSQSTEDERTDVTLNQTCFYPRGGGQDWDTGKITSEDAEFAVEEVRLDETGNVHHIGSYQKGSFVKGDNVTCLVDSGRRSVNSRLHSAGHVIDMAIDSLGLVDWIPTKGQHYPHLSAVEYSGTLDPEKAEELRVSIENKANEFIQKATENKIVFMPVEEMHTICRHVPENIPKNKPGRIVIYGDNFGIPCGGTHVKNLGQIGKVTVPKLKEKKGVTRVNYTVEGIGQQSAN